ncbi:MAG: hypothetical protein JNM25_05340 [Planctomycetes bacterium]|nr:hypothetical protein [Planctomycetota bacterium]
MSAGNEREHEIDDRIADWVDGRLSDRDHDRFVAELRVNPQLRRDLEEYERTVAAVREALQAPTEPVQLADRVLAAIAAGQAPVGGGAAPHRWRPLLWSLASAAALLLIALLIDAWSAPARPEANLTAKFESAAGRDPAGPPKGFSPGGGERPEAMPPADLDELLTREVRTPPPVAAGREAGDKEQRRQAAPAERERPDADGWLPVGAVEKGRPTDEPTATTALPGAAPAEPKAARVVVSGGAGARAKGPPSSDDEVAKAEAPGADPGAVLLLERAAAEQFEEAGAPSPAPVPTPIAVDPLPLVVVLGRAPATSDLFAARARADRKSKQPEVGESKGGEAKVADRAAVGAQSAETKADDAGRRFEAFFTAQVAEMTHVAPVGGAPVGGRAAAKRGRVAEPSREADAAKDARRGADAGWLQVADVRMLRLTDDEAATTGAVDRGDEANWIERDWLVEGSRQDVAALLGRLATFTDAVQLQLRTGETTGVPATKTRQLVETGPDELFLGQPATDRQRIVLRFRLQSR